MSERKWNPGPWIYPVRGHGELSDYMIEIRPRRPEDAQASYIILSVSGVPQDERDKIFASLMLAAHAPDLYEALERLCEYVRPTGAGYSPPPAALRLADATLAKACGETAPIQSPEKPK